MGDRNLLSTLLGWATAGTQLIRRSQIIYKDFSKASEATSKPREILLIEDPFLPFARKILNFDFKDFPVPQPSSRYDLLLGVPHKVSCNHLLQLWKDRFPCSSHTDDLDAMLKDPTPSSGYMMRIYDSVEPDEETMGNSASELRRKAMPAITLAEVMIAELYHFHSTRGGHLNLMGSTICAGSPCVDGTYPKVEFAGKKVTIDWIKANETEPRAGTKLVVRKREV